MANRTHTNRNEFYPSDDEQYVLEQKYNAEPGRISSNLNQITKHVNATGNMYEEDIKEVKELMSEVWRTQKSMLLKQPLIKQ